MPHNKFDVGNNPFVQSLMGSLGTGIASKAVSFFNKKEKKLSPKQQGLDQKTYFESLYGNNLNPWEWAGAGGHGQGGTAAPNAQGLQARNTLQNKQNVDISMQQAQLKNNIDVAKIGAGLTPGEDVDPKSPTGTNIRKMEEEIKNIKTTRDILATAQSMAKEIQAVINTLKGEKPTMLKQAQDGLGQIIEHVRKKDINAAQGVQEYKRKLQRLWNTIKPKIPSGKSDVHLKFKKSPRSTSSPGPLKTFP